MQSCVDSYEQLAGWKCIRQVETPFLPVEEEPPSKEFVSAVAHQLQQRGSFLDKMTPDNVHASLQCAIDAQPTASGTGGTCTTPNVTPNLNDGVDRKGAFQSGHNGLEHSRSLGMGHSMPMPSSAVVQEDSQQSDELLDLYIRALAELENLSATTHNQQCLPRQAPSNRNLPLACSNP